MEQEEEKNQLNADDPRNYLLFIKFDNIYLKHLKLQI